MDTWRDEDDFIADLQSLNEFSGDEVNENFWLREDSSNEAPPPCRESKSNPDQLSTETNENSTAAAQQQLQYDIISDMTKANIQHEPDYGELFRHTEKANVASKKRGKKKFRPISEEQNGPAKQSTDDWQPIENTMFVVKQEDFPQLK